MKNGFYLFSIIIVLALASCAKTEPDIFGRIHGIVTDAESGEPIRTASVTLTGGKTTTTGSDGRYDFGDLEAGEYTVQISKTGYQTNTKRVNVESGVTAQGDILMYYGAGFLKVNKSNIEFGTNNTLTVFEITNTGQHDLNWEITKDCEWITEITPSSGVTRPGAKATVTIKIDRSKVTGTAKLSTTIIVSSNGGGQEIIVSVNGVETPGGDGGGGSAVTNGLLAYYTFNDGTANDATDNKLDANLINTPDLIADTPTGEGKALHLNKNKEQYLNIPSNPFKDKTKYSVSFWIKDSGEGVIFAAVGASYGVSTPRLMCISGKLALDVTGFFTLSQVPTFDYGASAIQDGKWHLVVIATDGNKTTREYVNKLYVDGKLADTSSYFITGSANATKFQFGGKGGYTADYSTSMKLDNIRLYDRELSDEDVKTIYEAEK